MSLLNTVFNETTARFVSAKGDPQHAGFQLNRRWEQQHAAYADTNIVALNADLIYTDPKADRQAYSGTFISSKLEPEVTDIDVVDIYQTLTKVKDTHAEADWKLVKMEGDPAVSGCKLNRASYFINPSKADGIFTQLNVDNSLTNPTADGQTYAGTYVLSKIISQKEEDRSITIIETNTKVTAVTGASSLTNPLIDREKEVYHPFGEGRGTGDKLIYRYPNLLPSTDTKCMVLTDTALEAKALPTNTPSWDLVDRKTEDQEDNTMTFYLLFRQVHRIDWVSDSTYRTPHQRLTENTGRDNELRIKKWFGIDRNDHATVLGDLTAAHADTGFAHLKVEYQDVEDGAKDYQWYLLHQSGDTRTDSSTINSFDFVRGDQQVKVSRNWNRLTANIPTDATMRDTGWTFLGVQTKPDGNGLFNKEFQQGKVVWKTWGAGGYAADHKEKRNPGTDREERVKTWYGIRNADVTTAITSVAQDAGNTPADTGYHVVEGAVSNQRNGSITVTQTMVHKYDSKVSDSQVLNPHGLQTGRLQDVRWVYDNYTATEVVAITEPALPSGYKHISMKTDGNGHGFFTRVYTQAKATWNNTTPTYDTDAGSNLGGYDKTKRLLATGVPVASVPNMLAGITGDSCINKSFAETGDGEGRINATYRNGARKVTVTRRTHTYGHQRPSTTKTWYGVKPTELDTTFTAARSYTGESGDTGFRNVSATKDVYGDGYGKIEATASYPDSLAGGSDNSTNLNKWKFMRSFTEKIHETPLAAKTADRAMSAVGTYVSEIPADRYYWRHIREYVSARYSKTALGAFQLANDTNALIGSFSKYAGNGLWYAERVDSRLVTRWQSKSLSCDTAPRMHYRKDTAFAP